MADSSESDDEEVSEVDSFIIEHGDLDEEAVLDTSRFLLTSEGSESPDLRSVDPETQARLEALLEAAGKLSTPDGKHLADPEVLRKLTSSVSCALDEAAAALTRMRAENSERLVQGDTSIRSLAEACTDGDVGTVRKLLDEGRSVHETTEEGESLLSLACSAGYFELAQVLLAMRANVEDRGIKGDCTPLMEAASSGHADIVRLLIAHGADVNAQSSSGNTPLMYACAGGYEEVVKILLDAGSNVEDHNENGHTPLMEAASAGHVNVARILLEHGAGINTHSNEFKESALTLACYKGHLEMVRFLLEAGADQEHKTDEMHTALMEASMDGHVDVARLLLDSGAQVNMPADSFESPLTLAACGGHVELAMLLLERGASIEEVNDEGYTPLMEAAREGHEEMVALLLSQGADINAQTEETQETALTLACCGGFLDVADFLIKAGADIELGASSPLMEAAQEGHLDLVRYLLDAGTNVHAQTQTGDTALTYACENGHTDVADLLLQANADLEHQSEGGRTPLMKAARAGHMCTVQFLISRGADVNRQTTNNDHTPLSLACAGGHLPVVELLLAHGADPTHQLKDNSTMLIEAAKGGHIGVVQLLLDYPHNMMTSPPPPDLLQLTPPNFEINEAPRVPPHGLQAVSQEAEMLCSDVGYVNNNQSVSRLSDTLLNIRDSLSPNQGMGKMPMQKQPLGRTKNHTPFDVSNLFNTAEVQQTKNTPQLTTSKTLPPDMNYKVEDLALSEPLEEMGMKRSERFEACINSMMKSAECRHSNKEEQIIQKQQILEELHRVERELQEKAQAQLLLNAAAAQQQQRLELQQQQQQGILPMTACLASPTSTTSSSMISPGILEMVQMAELPNQLADLPDLLNQHRVHSVVQSSELPLEPPKLSSLLSKTDGKGKKHQQQQQQQHHHQLPLHVDLLDSEDGCVQSLDFAASCSEALLEDQQLMNPERLQTLSLKAIAHSEQIMGGFRADLDESIKSVEEANLFENSGMSLPVCSSAQALCAGMGALEKTPLIGQNSLVQQSNTQLGPLDPHSFVGTIPLDSSVMATLGGVGSSGFPVSLAMTPGMMAATPVTLSPAGSATVPLLDEGLMVAAPAKTLHETLGDMTGSLTNLTNTQQIALGNQVAPQYISTNTVATQCMDQGLATHGAVVALQLPFLSSAATTSTVMSVATTSSQIPLQTLPTFPALNVNSQTDSNRDTALTLACAGGHDDLVQLLLNRGASLEHRDKKGFTPLILAATAGHARVVEILITHGADIEAQSERTKDTPLSLACSGGRYEVVELLLGRGANKEHRNVSDYTPLSLAASGGYVNIIKLLLNYGAEINSRTNSKLGISPLMLAAMNGHTAAVKLLLDNGGDINAQIETNRNTALTLACFQGRHEVVSLLVDRKANVEHRAKTGLTPLMEAASGGYVEVGRVLIEKGADVNASPVPSSRDTALTIAADKGHYRFVELLLSRGAQVEVKNKKGNSPLWLAANGGHLDVVQLLVSAGADIDSQDNRKVSCLMAAFRKGHIKVVKWMVRHVSQFPSDQEMTRFIATITDKDLLKKCHQCMENIRIAKDRQAVEANKHATILLEELDMEKTREESKKAAAARRRERKRKKKKEKQERKLLLEENKKNESKNASPTNSNQLDNSAATSNEDEPLSIEPPTATTTTTIGAVITATASKNSKQNNNMNMKNQTAKVKVPMSYSAASSLLKSKMRVGTADCDSDMAETSSTENSSGGSLTARSSSPLSTSSSRPTSTNLGGKDKEKTAAEKRDHHRKECMRESRMSGKDSKPSKEKGELLGKLKSFSTSAMAASSCSSSFTCTTATTTTVSSNSNKSTSVTTAAPTGSSGKRKKPVIAQYCSVSSSMISGIDDYANDGSSPKLQKSGNSNSINSTNHKKSDLSLNSVIESFVGLSVDGYELSNLGSVRNATNLVNSMKSPPASLASPKRGSKREEGWKEVVRRSKKVLVPANAISRVIGRGGCNINAIREVSGAHIEVEKQKGAGDRTVIIKGSADATRQAHQLISALIKDPDRDLLELLPRNASNKSASQVKLVNLPTSNASQVSSTSTSSSQSKVTLVAFSSSSSSSLSSSSSCSSSTSTSSSVPGVPARGSKATSSSNTNPSMGIYSTPPFPATHLGTRPVVLNSSNSRPGILVSPLGSAFTNSGTPAWSLPHLSSSVNNSSPKRVTLIHSTSITTTATNMVPVNVVCNAFGGITGGKNGAARQLFPTEKRSALMTQTTTTSTKATVSYTTAAASQVKTSIAVSVNSSSFASKVTKSKSGMTTVSSKGSGKSTASLGNIRAAQSSPNISQPSLISSTPPSNNPPLMNGPMMQPIGSQHRSQPSTPTSSGSLLCSTSSAVAPGQPKTTKPQEYSPFNSFFSQVAQQSVWGKEKDGDGRGMNFASVAAAHMKGVGSSVPNVASSAPVPVPSNENQLVDESKAPGYRGNSHTSPNSNLAISVPASMSGSNSLPNSAPHTPPIGPIAPPNSASHSRRSPSPLLNSSLQARSPAQSPILSTGSSGVHMNSTSLQITNLAPGGPPSLASPGGSSHNAPLNLLANHGSNLSPNISCPLHLNPAPSYPSATSPHAQSPRFTSQASMSNNMVQNSAPIGIQCSNSLPIQSNLNPNAPDFSSRAGASMINPQQPPMSFIRNRMNPFGDCPTPPLSAFRPIIAVTSTTNLISNSPMVPPPPQGGPNCLPYLLTLQQQSQQQAPMQNVANDLNSQPVASMMSGTSVPEAVRMLSNPGVYAPRQQPIGSGSVQVQMGPQPMGANMNAQAYTSMPMLIGQRSISSTPSMGTSSKDEDSSTISPSASPQTSDPNSPTGMGVNSGAHNEHQMKAIGEDRKFLRPIGTERAHRKGPAPGPGYSRMPDVSGIWSYSSAPDGPPEAQEASASLYVSRFDEVNAMENHHQGIEQPFQPAVLASSVPAGLNMNTSYPFVNGIPPHMLSQLYGGNGNGLMNETWPNTVKLGAGDSAMNNATGQPTGPIPHVIQEQKMVWNNWNQPQM